MSDEKFPKMEILTRLTEPSDREAFRFDCWNRDHRTPGAAFCAYMQGQLGNVPAINVHARGLVFFSRKEIRELICFLERCEQHIRKVEEEREDERA